MISAAPLGALLEQGLTRGRATAPHRRSGAAAQRPRLAVITPWHPEPVDNGSKQRLRQVLAALTDTYDVVLISLLSPGQYGGGAPPGVPGVWQQHTLPLPIYRPRAPRAVLAALQPLPRSFVMTWDQHVATTITKIVEQTGVALAIGADLRVLRYLLALSATVPIILDEANPSLFIAGPHDGVGLARWRAVSRQRKYARLLRTAARRLDAVIVASSQEALAYSELAGSSRIMVIENGVGRLPEPVWSAPLGTQLLYAGSLSYGPNAEAVAYFAQAILPRIERDVPTVQLVVTGALPDLIPPTCLHPRVVLTDYIDRAALELAYRDSRACVVPLLSGSGTRIKLLEALALGIPVVATRKGAEGLDVVAGEDLLIADNAADFATATTRLLRDTAFAALIGACGRKVIQQRYTWDVRGQRLRDLVDECLRGRKEDVCTARRG